MRGYEKHLRALAMLATVAVPSECQMRETRPITASHTEANVPKPADFQRLLSRSLTSYWNRRTNRDLQIEWDLLRQAPTQAGTAYPKYYVWVKALDGKQIVAEGAARVAAIGKERFDVTDFLSREEIRTSPNKVDAVFPAALKSVILKRATPE